MRLLNMRNLANLETLIFENNRATILDHDPEPFLQGASSLKKLSLKNNLFFGRLRPSRLPELFLRPVANTLEYLDISQNEMVHLNKDMFVGMKRIRYLNIVGNMLRTIPSDSFANMAVITRLAVGHNHIEPLDPETFRNLPNLRSLDIGDNRFKCDCELLEFQKWAKVATSARQLDVNDYPNECYSPLELKLKHASLFNYEMSWIACYHHLEMVVGAMFGFFAVILISLAVCVHYYRHDIVFWSVITIEIEE